MECTFSFAQQRRRRYGPLNLAKRRIIGIPRGARPRRSLRYHDLMSFETNILIGVSMAGLLFVSGLWARKTGEWRMLIALVIGLTAFGFFLNRLFGFPATTVASMGTREDLALLAALYLCMLLGMFAQYAYRHFERPLRHRTRWDWGLFIAPVFASPIVFVPLATSCIGAGIELKTLTTVKFMIFFVAFQNGFFWKEFFDLKRREVAGN